MSGCCGTGGREEEVETNECRVFFRLPKLIVVVAVQYREWINTKATDWSQEMENISFGEVWSLIRLKNSLWAPNL